MVVVICAMNVKLEKKTNRIYQRRKHMNKIDIVNKHFINLINDFHETNYCPSYFELEDNDDFHKCGSGYCEVCWEQEAEENKDNILKALWKLYDFNNSKIKVLHEKERNLLDKIQELCPHKNTEIIEEHEWPDYSRYFKCKDCGKIL
jgi:hypothetical protein